MENRRNKRSSKQHSNEPQKVFSMENYQYIISSTKEKEKNTFFPLGSPTEFERQENKEQQKDSQITNAS